MWPHWIPNYWHLSSIVKTLTPLVSFLHHTGVVSLKLLPWKPQPRVWRISFHGIPTTMYLVTFTYVDHESDDSPCRVDDNRGSSTLRRPRCVWLSSRSDVGIEGWRLPSYGHLRQSSFSGKRGGVQNTRRRSWKMTFLYWPSLDCSFRPFTSNTLDRKSSQPISDSPLFIFRKYGHNKCHRSLTSVSSTGNDPLIMYFITPTSHTLWYVGPLWSTEDSLCPNLTLPSAYTLKKSHLCHLLIKLNVVKLFLSIYLVYRIIMVS